MSSRKPQYAIGVILLAAATLWPPIEVGLAIGPWTTAGPVWLQQRIPGIGETIEFGNRLTHSMFWSDRYVTFEQRRVGKEFVWEFIGSDPETGEKSNLHFDWNNSYPRRYGYRFFLAPLALATGKSSEVIDGTPQLSEFFKFNDRSDNVFFLLDGDPAEIENGFGAGFGQRFILRCFSKGAWNESLSLDVPNPDETVQLGHRRFRFLDAQQFNILQCGEQTHVFLRFKEFVLYRNGLKTKSIDSPFTPITNTRVASGTEAADHSSTSGATATVDGWSLAGESTYSQTNSPQHQTDEVLGDMMIGGQPAFMIVDRTSLANTAGCIFRFDGDTWALFATQEFPFGANLFKTDARGDGQASYIVVTTSMGVAHVYAVDEQGIRPTFGGAAHHSHFFWGLSACRRIFTRMLMIELILYSMIGFLMWLYTRRNYEFGTQSVRLASLGRRGVARLIDLSLIIGSGFVFGRILTADFDWMTWLEAINLKADHPSIKQLTSVVTAIVLWWVLVATAFVYMQGRWSVTPGKWVCGIRLLRATLKPCGFGRSLAREVVLSVDSCNLICWTPGVLTIAFTDCRQRLGDLVADTIVILVAPVEKQ